MALFHERASYDGEPVDIISVNPATVLLVKKRTEYTRVYFLGSSGEKEMCVDVTESFSHVAQALFGDVVQTFFGREEPLTR